MGTRIMCDFKYISYLQGVSFTFLQAPTYVPSKDHHAFTGSFSTWTMEGQVKLVEMKEHLSRSI